KYCIGYCPNKNSQMKYRVVVPILDNEGKYIIGATGRTIFPQCSSCGSYHFGDNCSFGVGKWRHSNNLDVDNILFNFWNAKSDIKKKKKVIISESPMDVLRLEDAGIHNAVASLGSNLTDGQKLLIDGSGALELIIPAHNDVAGQKMIEKIKEKYNREYKITVINLNKK